VFDRKQPKLAIMDQLPWYRRLFNRTEAPDRQSTLDQAGRGDADAQFALGLKFSAAQGPSQDLAQAAQWYQKAADQNHPLAQFNLSVMFAAGQGVQQNDSTALMWARKAAEGGDAGGQFKLGSACHRTSMSPIPADSMESRVEAYKWFHLAADQGYKGSDAARERLTLSMTREEVDAGNERVAAFVVRKSSSKQDPSSSTVVE
jgi:TPR repeat protein